MDPITLVVAVGGGVILLTGIILTIVRLYRQVDQGKVLIVNTLKSEPLVTFSGAVVFPIINRAEVMDISLKTVEIDRRGKEGLICQDNIRADIKVTFFVRVNKTREDVLKVAQSIGCARASDQETLEKLFEAKFSEALKTVGKNFDFVDLYTKRAEIKDNVVEVIGKDLNGYMLEDCAIDYLEQTPVEMLDKDNILDAEGIRKITKLTTEQNVITNELKQTERQAVTKRNVEADQSIFELERQREEASAKQRRAIETVQAEESAETERVKQEQHSKAELARIKAEQEILVQEQNKSRDIEVAQKHREREVSVEAENVERARALAAISRERETELERIAKERALEEQKKDIADVVRARIAVEKTVAQEEERIKDLRVESDALRRKQALIITAEGQAQEKTVKDVNAAKANSEMAVFIAKEKLTLAEADLEAADKTAKAKMRLADGVQAEAAAEGLAGIRVKEADAAATEKLGMAQVRVKEAEAGAIEKQGHAQAQIVRERLLAEAAGEQEKGLAKARVLEAEAVAIQKRGEAEAVATKEKQLAEAAAIQEKLLAEARGLAEKAASMKLMDGVGREHEEFRLRLNKERDVELETIRVRKDVAHAQAEVLAKAFANAKFNIVGGDGQFFERFVKAVSFGTAVDGALEHGEALKTALGGYLNGEKDFPADLKEILSKPGLSNDAQNLAVAALLHRMAPGSATDATVANLKALLAKDGKASSSDTQG
ncbi:hypothetical protein MYSTI_04400 [Myxococcus stipitatus DSM 14675]|uniref:Inner membrane protein YqiK n=1 Tax=Myxococcus stipitatus (strain DSM 14675 / JCM 12634 / Mx s8) TaxID=1278073 RepID=L7U9S8_MYXSD|nr:hypothetical protein [Myxococcus stipitatus]AGC45696.1 hypothetical protein MYSTI_04400 [Myxococcus stipitatus DSM 14675]